MANDLCRQRRGDRINLHSASLLLNQPLDILFEILDHLPPDAAVSLALSCKLSF
ncbi:hypothetical protein K445DRAFT_315939 [Daldinia sp. EC12]|nr:hypothetical protein K445DRAFT_315939 [Daldinia sp. EC12]